MFAMRSLKEAVCNGWETEREEGQGRADPAPFSRKPKHGVHTLAQLFFKCFHVAFFLCEPIVCK